MCVECVFVCVCVCVCVCVVVVVVVCTGHMGWRRFTLLGLYPLPEEELGLSQER